MHTHTHDSQHLREIRGHNRGDSLFGACHADRGFAQVFVLKAAFQGFGPDELDTACGIREWKTDEYDTSASDDHQYGADAPSEDDDMDVAADDDEEESESDCSAEGNCVWELPEEEIPDEPQSSKCTYTHRIT